VRERESGNGDSEPELLGELDLADFDGLLAVFFAAAHQNILEIWRRNLLLDNCAAYSPKSRSASPIP
jgi:hypothetical protein